MSTNVSSIQVEARSPARMLRKLLWVAPLAMLIATVANLILYVLAGAIAPSVTAWPGAGPGQIIGSNVAYLFFGAIALAVIARFSSRPVRHFLIVAIVSLLLSLALPVGAGFGDGAPNQPPADVATVIALSLMHVVSFAITVPLFIRLLLE